ncbi:hypothetical protein HQO82_13645 [Rhodococcus fascians]|nr:hypothetical protein [Rhodococcus fascians]MBY4114868.1 hypothetical protein [Rhodococcus fascians]
MVPSFWGRRRGRRAGTAHHCGDRRIRRQLTTPAHYSSSTGQTHRSAPKSSRPSPPFEDRLFVPYQAALEYQRGREDAIKRQRALIDETVSDFTSAQQKAAGTFGDKAVNARVREAWETARDAADNLRAALHGEYDFELRRR